MKTFDMMMERLSDLVHEIKNDGYNPDQWKQRDKIKALRKYHYREELQEIYRVSVDGLDECSEEDWQTFCETYDEVARMVEAY